MIKNFEYKNEEDIIAFSKLVHSHGMRPLRVVLRKLEPGKFVTHIETMGLVVTGNTGTWVHEAFHHGNYFGGSPGGDEGANFEAAMEDYKNRAGRL